MTSIALLPALACLAVSVGIFIATLRLGTKRIGTSPSGERSAND